MKTILAIAAFLALCGSGIAGAIDFAGYMAAMPIVHQPEQGALVADENQAPITMPLTTGNATLVSTQVQSAGDNGVGIIYSTGAIASSSTLVYTTTTNGNLIAVQSVSVPMPELSISCADDTNCTINAADKDKAIALLERIANRSVTMDVVYYGHDNNCHPQHEIIAAKPDLMAER